MDLRGTERGQSEVTEGNKSAAPCEVDDLPVFTLPADTDYLVKDNIVSLRAHPESAQTSEAIEAPHRDTAETHRFHLARGLDIVISLAFLLVLLPVMALIALAIYLFDPGPILFRHERIGYRGSKFRCLKFRSMYHGAEDRLAQYLANDPAMRRQWYSDFKLNPDPRVTPLGRFLREKSLDELPQLFNVLRGEMSLVGPRPIVNAEVRFYRRYISHYYSVKPGLTGLWQVSGRNQTTYLRRVALDVYYSRNKSLKLDLAIMAATIPAVLFGKGAS